jgi:hypothetical protein
MPAPQARQAAAPLWRLQPQPLPLPPPRCAACCGHHLAGSFALARAWKAAPRRHHPAHTARAAHTARLPPLHSPTQAIPHGINASARSQAHPPRLRRSPSRPPHRRPRSPQHGRACGPAHSGPTSVARACSPAQLAPRLARRPCAPPLPPASDTRARACRAAAAVRPLRPTQELARSSPRPCTRAP